MRQSESIQLRVKNSYVINHEGLTEGGAASCSPAGGSQSESSQLQVENSYVINHEGVTAGGLGSPAYVSAKLDA